MSTNLKKKRQGEKNVKRKQDESQTKRHQQRNVTANMTPAQIDRQRESLLTGAPPRKKCYC